MSYGYWLYRAPADAGPLHEWEEERREPIGAPAEVRARLSALFPGLQWTRGREGGWTALGRNGRGGHDDDPYLEFVMTEADDEPLLCIAIGSPDPSTARRVMEAFDLNFCWATEPMQLVDLDAVDDDWRPRPAP